MTYTKIMNSVEVFSKKDAPLTKNELRFQRLECLMKRHADNTNQEVGFELLDENGCINPEAFGEMDKEDKSFVERRENSFAKIDDPIERKRFINEYKIEDKEDVEVSQWMLEDWNKKKRKTKSGLHEMRTANVFAEKLGPNYIVARTCDYDDYKNGVDLLIINKINGEVIGTFDEVHDRKNGDRTAEKEKKIIKQAQQGGAKVKYGLGIEKGRVVRKSLVNVPNFYLLLTIEELDDALDSENNDNLYNKFSLAIQQQAQMLLQQEGIPPILKNKLDTVSEFFSNKKTDQ